MKFRGNPKTRFLTKSELSIKSGARKMIADELVEKERSRLARIVEPSRGSIQGPDRP